MNFLKGELDAPTAVKLDDGTELACEATHAPVPRGTRVMAGVRPERAVVRPPSDGLPLKIELIEELGVGRLVHGQLAGTAMTIAIGPGEHLPPGDTIGVTIPPDAVHLFEAESGRRL
jgi:sn-glycerol 3-phosphate transport system ATP-binding protein